MPMSDAFFYPARPHDRALTAAGQVERLARAALRHLRSGRLELAAALPRGPARGSAEATGEWPLALAGAPADGAPILYLPAVAWSYRFQRPQHLALALARAGHP